MIQSIKFVRNSLGEGILIGFHIVGTGATELLNSVTKILIHPTIAEVFATKHRTGKFNKIIERYNIQHF